jgi:Gpi18-like mannosyltransferase
MLCTPQNCDVLNSLSRNPDTSLRQGITKQVNVVSRNLAKYSFPLRCVLFARIGLSLWLFAIWIIVDRYFPVTDWSLRETYGHLSRQPTLIGRGLLDVWLRWDAVHYMNIARVGYAGVGKGELNFPPLYPYLTGALVRMSFLNEIAAGLLISTIATLASFIFLYELILETHLEEKLARRTILVYTLYPVSFFLFAPYTDGLFLFFSVAVFLTCKRHQWILAGLFISLASLTRLQGVILVLPYLIYAMQANALSVRKVSLNAVSGLGAAGLGIMVFTIWRALQGTGSYLDTFKQSSNIVFMDPFTGLWLAAQQVLLKPEPLVIFELLTILLFWAVFIWMLTQKDFRNERAMLAYASVLLILFSGKHSLTASSLQSVQRYVLAIFPAFIGLSRITLKIPAWAQKIYLGASLTLAIIASTLYALWIFVG